MTPDRPAALQPISADLASRIQLLGLLRASPAAFLRAAGRQSARRAADEIHDLLTESRRHQPPLPV